MQSSTVACSLLLAGCLTNESGNLSATTSGDATHPAERGSPLAELRAACGAEGALLPSATVVHRPPYLQQLTTHSTLIGWVTTEPVGESVEITRPDGEVLATAGAERAESAVRAAGENQMWTTVDGLEPDTVYCYRVLQDGAPLTERIGFRTAPGADSDRPVRVLAFGDSGGGGSDQRALAAEMFDVPFELIIHTGDVAYDNGTIAQFEDNVFGVYTELFRHIPFYPAAGNHDYETLRGAPFRDVFALPGTEQWYSYDWGRVHFAALDTESAIGPQIEWLDADLAASPLPWKIVYLHKPPYSSGEHGSDVGLRAALAPILARHGVQLVLAGHDHDYERIAPQDGVSYIVTGGGGRGTRPVGASPFTAFATDVIHYVYFEVTGDELVLHAIDATGTEFDSLVVPRA